MISKGELMNLLLKNHKIFTKIEILILIYQLANYSAQFIDTVNDRRYNGHFS